MSEADIRSLDKPRNYKKRESIMNDWLNVIFKMMNDGHNDEIIYFYILQQANFMGSKCQLEKYIYLIGKNNFIDRKPFNPQYLIESVYPSDVIIINRRDLLKYLLTCNPKATKDKNISSYIDIIKEKYPITLKVEQIFKDFHSTIMGSNEDKLDEFLEKYEDSEIESFCNGLKKDITPIKNAISLPISSGFVEGNNNKFKLLKRIVYGRSDLVNLSKKCKLAFLCKNKQFSLNSLI